MDDKDLTPDQRRKANTVRVMKKYRKMVLKAQYDNNSSFINKMIIDFK